MVPASLSVRGGPGCSPDWVSTWAPEPFFPQASPWKAAFAGILTVLGLLLFGAGCFTRREHSAKLQERQRKEKLRRAKEEDQRAKEEALKTRGRRPGARQGGQLVLRGRMLGDESVGSALQSRCLWRPRQDSWRLELCVGLE